MVYFLYSVRRAKIKIKFDKEGRPVMKLIIVRHSISKQNAHRLISGGSSNPDLSPQGMMLARQAASHLDENKIDQVYASPLKRAYQTAQILTDYHKKIVTDDRLKEMNFGSWDGQDPAPLLKEHPDAFDFENFLSNRYTAYAQGAESYADVTKRCGSFLADLKPKAAGRTVMIVCHGFTIRGLMSSLFKLDIMGIGAVRNVSFTEIKLDESNGFKPRLLTFNRDRPAYFALKNN